VRFDIRESHMLCSKASHTSFAHVLCGLSRKGDYSSYDSYCLHFRVTRFRVVLLLNLCFAFGYNDPKYP